MKKPSHNAFSLIEMLVVVSIVAMLVSFVVPAVSSMMRGTLLSQAGSKVVACLSLARQVSLTRNHSVEVRLYQFGDPETIGDNASEPATGKYRAIQIFEIDDIGKAAAISKCELLPQNIIINESSDLSSLLDSLQAKTWTNANDPKISLPRVGTNYNCRAFRFFPGGSASPEKTGALWFLTLHGILDGANRTTPPADYLTIQIDPANGSLKVWRP